MNEVTVREEAEIAAAPRLRLEDMIAARQQNDVTATTLFVALVLGLICFVAYMIVTR